MEKLHALTNDFSRALGRMKEALAEPKTDLVRDAVIQRFEFTFELAWKSLQEINRLNGIEAYGPRNAIREAARLGLLDDPNAWLDTLEDRNRTTHTYEEALANEIYNRIPRFVALAEALEKKIRQYLQDESPHGN